MSVPSVSLPTSQPSYHNVPFTYNNPLPTIVLSVPLVVSSIPKTSYTFPSVSNVASYSLSSNDSKIIILAQTVSSLQQQLASLTQNKFRIPTCDMGSPLS